LTFLLGSEDGLNGVIPIGRPIANTQIFILDALRQPVPIGVKGEIYIAGDGVTAGYLNQPELTHERFVDNPFGTGKMYRTGDLARCRADGDVEFLGREDDQVKVRGFRIELGELEASLCRHPGVRRAIVVARRDARDEVRLIAYVVPKSGSLVRSAELREFLKEQLPEYMIPSAVALLPRLPLTANGKVDRQNLPEPTLIEEPVYLAPRNPTEEAIAGIWREVFRRERVGVTDNFFEMGGHSLMATQVISRVREQFRVSLDMRVLFDRPTIEGMAGSLQEAQASVREPIEAGIVPVSRERYRRS
jgi:acyl carrier protein